MTEHWTDIRLSTTITMTNWEQYKDVMPLGIITLFRGVYGCNTLPDVEMRIGPTKFGNLPKTWVAATEKYGETRVELRPTRHYCITCYIAGAPSLSESGEALQRLKDPWRMTSNAICGSRSTVPAGDCESHLLDILAPYRDWAAASTVSLQSRTTCRTPI